MRQTRQIPATLFLALLGLAMPAVAEPPSSPAQDRPSLAQATPGAGTRQQGGESHYDDIMDDVNAVIDAMEGSDKRGAAGFAAPAPEAAAAPTDDSAQPASQQNSARQDGTQTARAAGPHPPSPVVVELFTAQGCAACPPADDILADLAGQRDVLALSWHVDYWDYLGWPDDFARPEFSARQKGYNLARGARVLFTPQFIIGGETAIAQPHPAELMTAIKRELAEGDHLSISRREDGPRIQIELTPRGPLPATIAVELVRYLPSRAVEVHAGENRGRSLVLRNVVAASEVLAKWDGKATLRLTVTLGAGPMGDLPADTRHALLVQQMHGTRPGEIFAALVLD